MAVSLEGQKGWKLVVLGALTGGVLALGALHSYRCWSRWWDVRVQLAQDVSKQPNLISMSQALDDDVLREQFTRNVQFFGCAGQEVVLNAFVVVVGLGVSNIMAMHILS
jgi:hypothetical protein